jgi:hypothetical protein
LNANNKLCNANRNKLVFAAREVDTSVSDSSYLDLDKEDNNKASLKNKIVVKVKKCIINAIKL